MIPKDEPLAKGGLNGGHPPPLPCDLPMGGFPYEFGPETERKIPGAWHRLFSAHRLEGRFSDPRPHLEAPAASSRRATRPKLSKGPPSQPELGGNQIVRFVTKQGPAPQALKFLAHAVKGPICTELRAGD